MWILIRPALINLVSNGPVGGVELRYEIKSPERYRGLNERNYEKDAASTHS